MTASRPKQGFRGALTGLLGRLPSLRVGLRGSTVLEVSALGLVVVIAVVLRVLPLRWGPYFTAYDPLFQYRVTEYIVKNGFAAWFSWHDTLSWYPLGRNIAHSSFPGLPFSAAFVHSGLQALGVNVSVYDVCLLFPLLMASLTCIAAYFLGKDLGGGAVGLFTAFFMAISSAFISRTSLGFFDTENIGIFGMVTTSLLFLRSIEEEKPQKKRVLYAVAAGLSLAYLYASWGAARYAAGLLTLFMFALIPKKLYDRRHLVSYGFTMGIGYFFAFLVPKLGLKFLLSIENVAVFGFTLFLLVYEAIQGRIKAGRLLLITGVMLVLLVGGVFALESLGLIRGLRGKFLSVIEPWMRSMSPLLESVAEHKRSTWTSFFGDFGLTIGLALFGSYFALRKLEEKRLFGLLFFLSAIYFTGSMIRLALILSIPVSLMAAYGLKELLTPFVSATARRADRRARRRIVFGVSREMGVIFTVFILVATLPTVWNAADSAYKPTSLAGLAVPVVIGGSYPQDWLQALAWMRDNLPDDAVVVAWWDYGYWIEALANKTTLADGSTRAWGGNIKNIAKVMMSNHSESLHILEGYNATHILVFHTFNPNNPSQEWPFGDNVKWYWMAKIAGLNETDYLKEYRYTELFLNTTIYRLMHRQADPAHFKLAFSSKYGFVLVYEIEY